jgi:hypothetical protein
MNMTLKLGIQANLFDLFLIRIGRGGPDKSSNALEPLCSGALP